MTTYERSSENYPPDALMHQLESEPVANKYDSDVPFFGLASEPVRQEVKRTWGSLLKLQEADLSNSSKKDKLFAMAMAAYGSMPKWWSVWHRYLAARRSGQLPVVLEVGGPECPSCRVLLPTQRAQALRRGDAVLCEADRHILLLRA